MTLTGLGLTALDEIVYRGLLRGGDAMPGDPAAVRAALDRLIALELVQRDAGGRPLAVEPEIGISRLIRRRMLETSAEQRRISAAWETLHTLSTQARGPDSTVTIERIDGIDQINERIWSLALDAREVLTVHPDRRRPRADMLPAYVQRLREDVRWRTIVSRKCLGDLSLLEYSLKLHRAGDHHRVVDHSTQQMVIFDRSVAFVPSVRDAGHGALMIRQPGAVATMVDLFELVWAHAVDIEPSHAPPLTPRERQVLHLLATTDKDEIAAREMGVSLRTYRRRVAELLDRLGAANRFQAALLAKQQGWI